MIIAEGVKEPTHLSKRVGHVVPSVVVWPWFVLHARLTSLYLSPLDRLGELSKKNYYDYGYDNTVNV